jgi:colanic acid/amylovoran biosynthesis glycosyltransferase
MKLYYFTNSFPYGIGEQWKQNELNVLVNYFDEIVVIPNSYAGNFTSPKVVNSKIKVEQPLFESDEIAISKIEILKWMFSKNICAYIVEVLKVLCTLNKSKLIDLILAIKKIELLLTHKTIVDISNSANKNVVLYFYWGKGTSEIVPFLKISKFNKIVIKMHRYDLYDYANNGYIPFRAKLLSSNIIVAPSSNDGALHLKNNYPNHNAKIITMRCGTIGNNIQSKKSTDGKLRILSCSLLVPVKRIEIMIRACSLLNIDFEWKHIGFGPLEPRLNSLVCELGLRDKFIFLGKYNTEDILPFYTSNFIDLFVNVSKSEGVPFSIMEAFSAGIPVIATDAGGTKEIVDSSVGVLLENEIEPTNLAKAIQDFYSKDEVEITQIRNAAYQRYLEMCDANKLANELGKILIS